MAGGKGKGVLSAFALPLRSCRPVVEMELRVASRQRRTYAYRLAYVLVLMLYVAALWTAMVEPSGQTGAAAVARMSEAGQTIAVRLIWFQFIAGPLAAVFLMSTCLSDEINGGRLPSLLSTPLGFFQMTMGKFAGRLLQTLVLLVAGLPALAVVRVFGGVPWAYVICGMTLAALATLVAGAISMLCSFGTRRAYVAIAWSLLLAAAAAMPPGVWLANASATLVGGGAGEWVWWACLCMGMALAIALLSRCVQGFRRAALRAMGNDFVKRPLPHRSYGLQGAPAYVSPEGLGSPPPLRRRRAGGGALADIVGSPIVWRAMRKRFFTSSTVIFALACLLMGHLYVYAATLHSLGSWQFHRMVIDLFVGGVAVAMAILSSTAVTSEKQSGAWVVLLMTPLSDGEVLWAKALGVVKRCAAGLLILLGHEVIFAIAGVLHPLVLLDTLLILAYVTVFVLGLGLYASTVIRRSSTAALVTFLVPAALWVVLPSVLSTSFAGLVHAPLRWFEVLSPFGQVGEMGVSPSAGAGTWSATWDVFLHFLAYSAVGALMLWRAKMGFRRHAFR